MIREWFFVIEGHALTMAYEMTKKGIRFVRWWQHLIRVLLERRHPGVLCPSCHRVARRWVVVDGFDLPACSYCSTRPHYAKELKRRDV